MDWRWPGVGWIRETGRRWSRAWHGEYETTTLRSVPSWGMSLLLHCLLLLLLAFLVRMRHHGVHPQQIVESGIIDTALGDLTSLTEAKRSGDPFTLNDSLDPPSLGLEPADSQIKLVGQPRITALTQFAPVLAGPLSISKSKIESSAVNGMMRLPNLATSIVAPFSGRQGMTRAKLLLREGGTAKSEQSVEEGLNWMVRHQRADGSWSLNFQDMCQASPCPAQRAIETDTGATGLALLPLLGAGYIHTVKGRHQEAVRRGLDWLVAHQQPDGDLFTGPPGMPYLYSHAIGSMAICEAYGLSGDPTLKRPAQRAIQFIISAQDPVGGGWRYTPGQLGDTSVFGWQMFALRSAHLAGIKIPPKVLKACSRYLDQAGDQKRVLYSYLPGGAPTPTMTAEALLSRQLLGWPRDFPALVKGVAQITSDLRTSGDRNIYYWYYAMQLLHNMQNEQWEHWNIKIREALISTQVKDAGCAQGSWDPFSPSPDHYAERAGRLYLTSLSILTLEVYYRYLPLYRSYDEDQKKPGDAMKPSGDAKDAATKPDGDAK